MNKYQWGFTVPTIPTVLLFMTLAAISGIVVLNEKTETAKDDVANMVRIEIQQLIDAQQACFDENRAWCDWAQLQANYIDATGTSITNSPITFVPVGDDLRVSFDTGDPESANRLSRFFQNSVVAGGQIETLIEPPTASHIFTGNYQRYLDNEGFDRNLSQTSVDHNTKDVNNVRSFHGAVGRFDQANADSITTDTLQVNERLRLGANELEFINGINILADEIQLNGVTIGGDLTGTNGTLENFNNVDVNRVNADQVASTRGSIATVSGDSVEYTNATITTLDSTTLSSDSITSNTAITQTAVMTRGSGNVDTQQANIQNMDFTQASGANWNYATTQAQSLQSQNSFVGVAQADSYTSTGAISAGSYNGGSSDFTSITTGNFTGGSFAGTDFYTSVSSVNQNYVSATTTSTHAQSNQVASVANSQGIANTAAQISTNTQGIAQSKSDSAANTSSIANTASDIATNVIDINSNARNIRDNKDELQLASNRLVATKSDLDECMYTTLFCIPQDPNVVLTCPNCTQNAPSYSFNATATATINDCRQGCTYSWVTTGSMTYSGCTSGSVPQGGTATPSCRVSATVGSLSQATGTITINVRNAHYTSRVDSASVGVDFFNSSPPTPVVAITSCVDCINDSPRSSFTATLTGSINNCPLGCEYQWSVTGGAAKGVCSNGSVAAGASATPSCGITGSGIAAQSILSGGVTLSVNVLGDTSINASAVQNYRWANNSPALTLSNIVDVFCPGGCFALVPLGQTGSVTIYPRVEGLKQLSWPSTSCPDCRATISVTGTAAVCRNLLGNVVPFTPNLRVNNLGEGMQIVVGIYNSEISSCALPVSYRFDGIGQTTTVFKDVVFSTR